MILPAANAWEIKDEMVVNMTLSDLLEFEVAARAAGMAETNGMFAKGYYDAHIIGYADFFKSITTDNKVIRSYNAMLDEHFNQTIVSGLKMTEFTL